LYVKKFGGLKMHNFYHEIIASMGEPIWWDEVGVPRYCEFGPMETNNIYAYQVALIEIACQDCGKKFKVAMSWHPFDNFPELKKLVMDKSIHYGDPPNISCCPAGPTMNCYDLRVIEFWESKDFDWVRMPELEIMLPDSEAPNA
jgi:hypothetical protein